ncbi:MAG: redoxin domain-containing protein [bacterium]
MLTIGTKAPDFTLSTITAEGPKRLTLSSEIGKNNILLLFVPAAFTSVCTAEFCEISKGIGSFGSLDCSVFGISGDSPFAQKEWAAKEAITIPLLSDYEHTAAKAYGVAYESFLPELGLGFGGVAKRSAFLIDRTGLIQYAESSDDPKQLPDFDAIKTKLSELK